MTRRGNPYEGMSTSELEEMRNQIEQVLYDRSLDAEELAERRYFDMCDPAYVSDLRTPFEDTLEYDSMMDDYYNGDSGPEWGDE